MDAKWQECLSQLYCREESRDLWAAHVPRSFTAVTNIHVTWHPSYPYITHSCDKRLLCPRGSCQSQQYPLKVEIREIFMHVPRPIVWQLWQTFVPTPGLTFSEPLQSMYTTIIWVEIRELFMPLAYMQLMRLTCVWPSGPGWTWTSLVYELLLNLYSHTINFSAVTNRDSWPPASHGQSWPKLDVTVTVTVRLSQVAGAFLDYVVLQVAPFLRSVSGSGQAQENHRIL